MDGKTVYMNGYKIGYDEENIIGDPYYYNTLDDWVIDNYYDHVLDWLAENNYPKFDDLPPDVKDFVIERNLYGEVLDITDGEYIINSCGQYVDLEEIADIMRKHISY